MTFPIFLGFLGTIPLIFSSFLTFLLISDNIIIIKIALSYSAVILSFLGAVHWGYLIKIDLSPRIHSYQWIWSVSGSLLGWISLVFLIFDKIIFCSLVLVFGFTISLVIDLKIFSQIIWYRKLRIYLSFIAILNIIFLGLI